MLMPPADAQIRPLQVMQLHLCLKSADQIKLHPPSGQSLCLSLSGGWAWRAGHPISRGVVAAKPLGSSRRKPGQRPSQRRSKPLKAGTEINSEAQQNR